MIKKILFMLTMVTSLIASPTPSLTGKLFVIDVEGTPNVRYSNGDKADLTPKLNFKCTGASIFTGPKDRVFSVYSNSTGLQIEQDSFVTINKFTQEPFTPNRSDMEVEPSVSVTDVRVGRGFIGVCTPRIVAGSDMTYHVRDCKITVLDKSKFVIESSPNGTFVYLVDGSILVKNDTQKIVLKIGTVALIGNSILVRDISDKEKPRVNEVVTMACISRSMVYFDVSEEGEITGTPTTPITPPGTTISPAVIP